jgi:hypothetical protein
MSQARDELPGGLVGELRTAYLRPSEDTAALFKDAANKIVEQEATIQAGADLLTEKQYEIDALRYRVADLERQRLHDRGMMGRLADRAHTAEVALGADGSRGEWVSSKEYWETPQSQDDIEIVAWWLYEREIGGVASWTSAAQDGYRVAARNLLSRLASARLVERAEGYQFSQPEAESA